MKEGGDVTNRHRKEKSRRKIFQKLHVLKGMCVRGGGGGDTTQPPTVACKMESQSKHVHIA